jgi:hypothetical protein
MTRPYQGISLPKSKYPGYEVDVAKATFFLHINEQKHHIVKIFRRKMEKSAGM